MSIKSLLNNLDRIETRAKNLLNFYLHSFNYTRHKNYKNELFNTCRKQLKASFFWVIFSYKFL